MKFIHGSINLNNNNYNNDDNNNNKTKHDVTDKKRYPDNPRTYSNLLLEGGIEIMLLFFRPTKERTVFSLLKFAQSYFLNVSSDSEVLCKKCGKNYRLKIKSTLQ